MVREEVRDRARRGDVIPAGAAERVSRSVARPRALHPVAELDTVRHQVDLIDGGTAASSSSTTG